MNNHQLRPWASRIDAVRISTDWRTRRATKMSAVAIALTTVLLLATGVAGARPSASQGAKIKIGYINLSDQIPFVVLVRKSIQRAAKANGVDLVVCDSNLDAQKAIQCASQFKTQKVDGILNFQLDESAAPRVCAAGPKVPVVAIDIHQKPCETVFYGADNYGAGRLSGVADGKYAKAKWNCKVDAFVSVNAPTAGKVVKDRERGGIQGFQSICPKSKIVRVTTKATTDSTIQPFRDTLTRLPSAHRLVVYATNDDQLIGALKAAQSVNRQGDIYLGGQGADPTAWPYLCGKSSYKKWIADVAYFPERYGDTAVPLLLSLIDGQKKPKQVYINHRVVTPSNIRAIFPKACK